METLFIGKNLLFLTEVESTNSYAMEMLRNVNIIEGTVIHTDNQTKGRGQRGAVWNSEMASNITASVVLRPQFLNAQKSFYLSKISALAAHDVLTEILTQSQYDIKIKWPNDILVAKKKIAGILIENTYQNNGIANSIIGIGLNVNQTGFGEMSSTATSLKILMNKSFDRLAVLENLCGKLEKWYFKLKENKLAEIDASYFERLYGLNQQHVFWDQTKKEFLAEIKDVRLDGKLGLLISESQELKYFDVKELSWVL